MSGLGLLQVALYFAVLTAAAVPLGGFIARALAGERTFLSSALLPVERLLYRLCGTHPDDEMDWRRYAVAVLLFSAIGLLVVYALQRLQGVLPLNPQGLGPVSPDSSLNTAISFVTNTNWQAYGGESTMSYLTQMLGLTVQNFVSAATGIAVLTAFIRGLVRQQAATIGNFWVDLVRSTLYVLLPLSIVLALALVSQGVVQNFKPAVEVPLLQATEVATPARDNEPEKRETLTTQQLPQGPAASQVAIKQLGTNGGGFFSVNSAHPYENPTPLSNFLQVLSILLIPAALCFSFGRLVNDPRQGWAVYAAMSAIFLVLTFGVVAAEESGNPQLAALGVDAAPGNMEGKETRFGVATSALWAAATTAASNGSVNSMHDSYTPLGGLAAMWLMQLGEVVFGGVGSGLYGMLAFVIVAVFVAGLMVGRTPEYLGKKIEAFDIKMVSLVILIMPLLVLVGTAVAVVLPAGLGSLYAPSVPYAVITNPGPHGFSQVLYAFSSAGNNNGSAFGGLGANNPFYNVTLGVTMILGRYLVIIPILALAGSLARKKVAPASAGTLPTDRPLFVAFLVGIVVVVGALTFLPALALGPIVEQLTLVLN